MELSPGDEPEIRSFKEVIGNIRFDLDGLHVTEFQQTAREGELGFPTRSDSFGCLLTGMSTSAATMMGNPRPEVMIKEWQSYPKAWWLMIGRVPPMPIETNLVSMEVAVDGAPNRAVYTNPGAPTIEVEFNSNPTTLRRIVYRHPDGRKISEVSLIGSLANQVLGEVVHPQLVVMQDFDHEGKLTMANCWLRIECEGFAEESPTIPAETLVAKYSKEGVSRERTLGGLPIDEVASWFFLVNDGATSESAEAPLVAKVEPDEGPCEGCSNCAPKNGILGIADELLLLAGGCLILMLGVFLRSRN